jgi:oligopeptide/dipeptide ABC transporter ATP-binding protein
LIRSCVRCDVEVLDTLLDVRDLRMHIFVRRGVVKAVDGVSFSVERGKSLGIVGESGSGKSMTLLSIMRVLPEPGGKIVGGEILFEGEDLLKKSSEQMRQVRGNRIAMITQDTLASLNPALTIGVQLKEPLQVHLNMRGRGANVRALDLLRLVQISDPASQMRAYPHQMSGGMRQRVVGAIAVGCEPRLLLADEPTTSLDVTVQAQYLRLLKQIQKDTGLAMIFVTHDFGIVAKVCDHVAVMYAGQIVETATTRVLFDRPLHPYSRALIDCLPQRNQEKRLATIPGHPPDLAQLPAGCSFAPRCACAEDECRLVAPRLLEVEPGHQVACLCMGGVA